MLGTVCPAGILPVTFPALSYMRTLLMFLVLTSLYCESVDLDPLCSSSWPPFFTFHHASIISSVGTCLLYVLLPSFFFSLSFPNARMTGRHHHIQLPHRPPPPSSFLPLLFFLFGLTTKCSPWGQRHYFVYFFFNLFLKPRVENSKGLS